MNPVSNFQPFEILCVEHDIKHLHAEVVQVVSARHLCWVRPLVLSVDADRPNQTSYSEMQQSTLYDLRQGSDLLLPVCLFRKSLDTETIPLLSQLGDLKLVPGGDRLAQQELQAFIWELWRARPDVFQNL